MDMLRGEQIAAAGLTQWRKLAQGLHTRYRIGGFGDGARFLTAIGEGTFGIMKRPQTGGRGLHGVAPKEPGYLNPAIELLEGTDE